MAADPGPAAPVPQDSRPTTNMNGTSSRARLPSHDRGVPVAPGDAGAPHNPPVIMMTTASDAAQDLPGTQRATSTWGRTSGAPGCGHADRLAAGGRAVRIRRPGLFPGQADQTGSAGGCHENLGPADRSFRRTARAASADSEVRPGPRPPTLTPHQVKAREAGPEALPTSSLPNLAYVSGAWLSLTMTHRMTNLCRWL